MQYFSIFIFGVVLSFQVFCLGQSEQLIDFTPISAYSETDGSPFIQQMVIGRDGSYGFSYLTSDGKTHFETRDAQGVVRGRYSYFAPNGKKIVVNYIADRNGFRVFDEYLPSVPESDKQIVNPNYIFSPYFTHF